MLATHARDPRAVIELDVRVSRDGQIVVMHDATVDRVTNGAGAVAGLTLAQLKALDAGHCATPGIGRGTARRDECRRAAGDAAFPHRGQGLTIPTLDEVLAALPRQAVLGIEVKGPGFEEKLAATLRAHGRPPALYVGSEHTDVARRLRHLLPEAAHYHPRRAATCAALAGKLGVGAGTCDAYDVLAIPRTAYGLDFTTRRFIDRLRARNVPVVYFTVNDEAEMERLFRAGAAGVITDYPARARKVLDRLAPNPDPAVSTAPGRR